MKKSYIILIIAILAALIVLYVEGPERSNDFKPFSLYPKLDPNAVAKIEVEHLISGSLLTKNGDVWKVTEIETKMGEQLKEGEAVPKEASGSPVEYLADAEKVNDALEKLGKLEAVSLVSTNPEKQSIFEVGSIAKNVRLYNVDGKILANLYIGKAGQSPFSVYVRRDGENEVYLASEHIGASIPADTMGWRNKKIWEFDPGFITGVNIENINKGARSFAISKDAQGVWHLSSPQEALLDPAKVNELVGKLSKLSAPRFAISSDLGGSGLDRPLLKLSVSTTDGGSKTLLVGGEDKQGYFYARLEKGSDETYLLDAQFKGLIPPDWNGLLPDPKGE